MPRESCHVANECSSSCGYTCFAIPVVSATFRII